MTSPLKLGGFKILKGLTRFSIILQEREDCSPVELLGAIAGQGINLPYLNYVRASQCWALNILVGSEQDSRTSLVIEEHAGKKFISSTENCIISIFPHKNNPQILGRLFGSFHERGIEVGGMANSLSTISVVLKEAVIDEACNALFRPFAFSTCNSPDEYMIAQRGKDEIYKEVNASYEEARPKVYGLEYYKDQSLINIDMGNEDMSQTGQVFEEYAGRGLGLTFSVLSPFQEEGDNILSFCLTEQKEKADKRKGDHGVKIRYKGLIFPVIVFSMIGPHFGDRYGIGRELLASLEEKNIDILCLSCTVASITGVIPSSQFNSLLEAMKESFEVPSVIERKRGPG